MRHIDIKHTDFRKLDLNLLVALDALLETRHVGRAAQRLCIGQPAMSHALSRLRAHFGDALLVRTGRHMEPTALALALWPQLRSCLGLAASLLGPREFDPRAVDASFRLALPDGLEFLLLPPMVAHLRLQAPGIRPRVQLVDVDRIPTALDNDELDLAIVAVHLPLRTWHHRQALLSSDFVVVASPAHLHLPTPATLADLAQLDHVVSSHRGEAASAVDACFAAQGLQRRVVASMSSLLGIRDAVRKAPLVCIQPRLYSAALQADDLLVVPVCIEPALDMGIDMVWHERSDGHPLHRHMRDLIRELACTL